MPFEGMEHSYHDSELTGVDVNGAVVHSSLVATNGQEVEMHIVKNNFKVAKGVDMNITANIWGSGRGKRIGFIGDDNKSNPGHGTEIFSRKVFIGGIPNGTSEDFIKNFFGQFGTVTVDWPNRNKSNSNKSPNGYAFLLFENSRSVESLVCRCTVKNDKYGLMMNNLKGVPQLVQVRAWQLADSEYFVGSGTVNPRFSVFVGGVPRTLSAMHLALAIQHAIGDVVMVSIEVEVETGYPRGAACVVFKTREAYVAASALRRVHVNAADQRKEVELKPFVLDHSICEGCYSLMTSNFCEELCCLRYYCDQCWFDMHSAKGLLFHQPISKVSLKTLKLTKERARRARIHTERLPSVRLSESASFNMHSSDHHASSKIGHRLMPTRICSHGASASPSIFRMPPVIIVPQTPAS